MVRTSRFGITCALLALVSGAVPGGSVAATVFLARRGWHTDIGFPSAELAPPLNSIAVEFPGARFVFFGFGDRRYLESKHRGMGAMLEALWPGEGVLLGTGLVAEPDAAFGPEHVLRFDVSDAEAAAAQRFVWNSFTTQQAKLIGTGQAGKSGPYDGSFYFGARAAYSAAHTCNTWAAEALAASQPSMHSGGVLFAGQLWRQARRQARRPTTTP